MKLIKSKKFIIFVICVCIGLAALLIPWYLSINYAQQIYAAEGDLQSYIYYDGNNQVLVPDKRIKVADSNHIDANTKANIKQIIQDYNSGITNLEVSDDGTTQVVFKDKTTSTVPGTWLIYNDKEIKINVHTDDKSNFSYNDVQAKQTGEDINNVNFTWSLDDCAETTLFNKNDTKGLCTISVYRPHKDNTHFVYFYNNNTRLYDTNKITATVDKYTGKIFDVTLWNKAEPKDQLTTTSKFIIADDSVGMGHITLGYNEQDLLTVQRDYQYVVEHDYARFLKTNFRTFGMHAEAYSGYTFDRWTDKYGNPITTGKKLNLEESDLIFYAHFKPAITTDLTIQSEQPFYTYNVYTHAKTDLMNSKTFYWSSNKNINNILASSDSEPYGDDFALYTINNKNNIDEKYKFYDKNNNPIKLQNMYITEYASDGKTPSKIEFIFNNFSFSLGADSISNELVVSNNNNLNENSTTNNQLTEEKTKPVDTTTVPKEEPKSVDKTALAQTKDTIPINAIGLAIILFTCIVYACRKNIKN